MAIYICDKCRGKYPHLEIDNRMSMRHSAHCEVCFADTICNPCHDISRFPLDTVMEQIEKLRTLVIEVHKSRTFYFVSSHYEGETEPTMLNMVRKSIFKNEIKRIIHNNVEIVKYPPSVLLKRVRTYKELTYIKNEMKEHICLT